MRGHFIPHTKEAKEKIRITKLGKPSGKKGKKFPQYSGKNSGTWKNGLPKCSVCNKEIGYGHKTCFIHKPLKEIAQKIIKTRREKNNYIAWNKGLKGYKARENHYNWKGGITPTNNQVRGSLEYKLWQDSVFNRDCNCCQKCHKNKIDELVAHHILNFSKYIELRFAIDNGITFCRYCHGWFHRVYGRQNNTREQLEKFLNL